jgi:aspartyl-tRNA(Asn)/glutamyl-tRNA(Gln) amidotransferase subunit A
MNVTDLSAVALIDHFARKTLSPLEYWDALEKHIARWEGTLHALYAYDPESARREAAAATERWAKGTPIGPLDGVPTTIKEMIATRGVPVPLGTAATNLVPAAEDAPPAARLREAGAIIFAKTTAPDYGMLSSGLSSFHPLARNPWDVTKNPGGSSAGASAAAAAGYGPLHVGTDIGGSIRLPAGWCGIVGFKPSLGRIPIDPSYVGRCAGPMTRDVADTALMMRFLSQPDWRDGMSLPPEAIDWNDLAIDVKGLRIGLMLEAGCGLPVDPEIRDAVVAAARLFERNGAIVEEVKPVLTRAMLDGLDDFWRARSWADIAALAPDARAKVLPYIRTWAERGADVSGVAAVRGFNQTMEMRKAAARLFRSIDALLTPTSPVVAFPAEWASPIDDPARPFEHIGFTVTWNMSEQPALSLKCGFAKNGMPMGMQIVGPRFADLQVLRLAKAYESWRGPIAWPQPQ